MIPNYPEALQIFLVYVTLIVVCSFEKVCIISYTPQLFTQSKIVILQPDFRNLSVNIIFKWCIFTTGGISPLVLLTWIVRVSMEKHEKTQTLSYKNSRIYKYINFKSITPFARCYPTQSSWTISDELFDRIFQDPDSEDRLPWLYTNTAITNIPFGGQLKNPDITAALGLKKDTWANAKLLICTGRNLSFN